MAEPEDPEKPTPPLTGDDFDDDLVGFAHPRALAAAPPRAPEPESPPEPEPVLAPEPVFAPEPEPEPAPETAPAPQPAPNSFFAPEPPPPAAAPSDDDYGRPGATRSFERPTGRASEPGVTAEGDGRMAMAIYVCLIGAALTAGLSVVIALLLSWMARFLVKGWTTSHLLYQLRTSFIGTIAGIIGVATLPLGLGVFVLSLTVIWVVVRGAAGLIRLTRHQPIRDPQTWSLP